MSLTGRLMLDDLPLDRAHEFNFDRIVDTLFRFITDERNVTPLSICIDGTWGAGKTSLMKTLQRRLEEDAMQKGRGQPGALVYVPLWFEPWKLTDETEVLNSLVNLVLRRIQDDAGLIASAKIEVDHRDAMRVLSQRFLQVSPDEVSAYYQWSSRVKGSFVEIEDLFRKIARTYLETGRTKRYFVILVDDLDRCPPPRIVAVLETVKLFFNMPGFLFIFGMDRTQIEQAVRQAYRNIDETDSRVYLEKMFQLTYSLPAKEEESLVSFVSEAMQDMGLGVQNRALLRALVGALGRNLRNLKLFLNGFNFHRHLIGARTNALNDEVLFKWLYLETMLPASMDVAIKQRSVGLPMALEFLAQGAVLDDPVRYNAYRHLLVHQPIQYLPLVVWAVLPREDPDEELDDGRLRRGEQQIVDALRRDRRILETLRVLREGDAFFIDQDLSQLAYLTRRETLDQEGSLEARFGGGDVLAGFGAYFILDKSTWDSLGDRFFYRRKDYRSAYLAYLLALLLDFNNPVYWSDLGATYRRLGYRDAALASFKQAHRVDPFSNSPYTQAAYLYDLDDGDACAASLLYRKTLSLGEPISYVPYGLAKNLRLLGDEKRAFLYALEAHRIDPEGKGKRMLAARLATAIGKANLDFEAWNDDLAHELEQGKAEGLMPCPLTEDEEQVLASMISEYPDLSDVREQIRSLPL